MLSIVTSVIVHPLLFAVLLLLLGCIGYLHVHGRDQRVDRFLVVLSLTVPCHVVALLGAMSAGYVRPEKLDLYVYRMDGLLGFQPSFVLGRLVADHLSLMILLKLLYELLPVVIAVVFGGYLWYRSAEAMSMVPVFVLNLALSVPFYLIFPVSGPAYAFPNYPALPTGPVIPHPIPLSAPPNGVPSIHFSSALLIFWYARKLPLGRWMGGAYLLFMAAATMGSGEHYLFDLLMALPYAAMIYRAGNQVARLKFPKPFSARSKSSNCPARA